MEVWQRIWRRKTANLAPENLNFPTDSENLPTGCDPRSKKGKSKKVEVYSCLNLLATFLFLPRLPGASFFTTH
jgi:hypothetical protein